MPGWAGSSDSRGNNGSSFAHTGLMRKTARLSPAFEQMSLDDLTAGNVVVKVSYSTINYKDALAATGAGKILRKYPLNGGIDFAGTVVSSEDADFQPGAAVLVNGCGLSEIVDGGYSEYARVDSTSLVPLPDGLDARQAMQIGTAGYTAALAIHRMEQNGQLAREWPGRRDRERLAVLAVLPSTCWPGAAMTSSPSRARSVRNATCATSARAAYCCASRSTWASAPWRKRSGPAQ